MWRAVLLLAKEGKDGLVVALRHRLRQSQYDSQQSLKCPLLPVVHISRRKGGCQALSERAMASKSLPRMSFFQLLPSLDNFKTLSWRMAGRVITSVSNALDEDVFSEPPGSAVINNSCNAVKARIEVGNSLIPLQHIERLEPCQLPEGCR